MMYAISGDGASPARRRPEGRTWRYAALMTAEAHAAERPLPASTPSGVRSALAGGDRVEFEREYRAALAQAGVDFELTQVHDVVERWWRVAVLSADPAAHQRMQGAVADLRAGRPVASTPWREAIGERDA